MTLDSVRDPSPFSHPRQTNGINGKRDSFAEDEKAGIKGTDSSTSTVVSTMMMCFQ